MGILKRINVAKQDGVLALSILILWVSRITTFIAFPMPVSAPDSGTYYSGEFLNFDLVSLTGHAARGWFIPAIYSLMPNALSLEFVQLFISATVWTFLLVTIKQSKIVNIKFTKYLVIVLAVLGSSAQLIQHDTTILATSITNSIFIFLLALLIRVKFISGKSKMTLSGILAFGFILSVQKTTFLPIAVVMFLLSLFAVNKLISIKVKALFVALSLMAILLTISIGSNVNKSWQVSYSGQTLLWQLGGQSPTATEFSSYLIERGAPSCITEDAPFGNLDISIGKILNECPAGSAYIESSIQKDFILFVLTHPVTAAKLAIFGMGAALTDSASNYGNTVSILPRSFATIFFGESYPNIVNNNVESQVEGMNFLNSGKAIWLFTPLLSWLLLALCGTFFSRSQRKDNHYLLFIMAICLAQALFAVILLPSEWVRQTSPFILGALITSIILTFKLAGAISEEISNSDK